MASDFSFHDLCVGTAQLACIFFLFHVKFSIVFCDSPAHMEWCFLFGGQAPSLQKSQYLLWFTAENSLPFFSHLFHASSFSEAQKIMESAQRSPLEFGNSNVLFKVEWDLRKQLCDYGKLFTYSPPMWNGEAMGIFSPIQVSVLHCTPHASLEVTLSKLPPARELCYLPPTFLSSGEENMFPIMIDLGSISSSGLQLKVLQCSCEGDTISRDYNPWKGITVMFGSGTIQLQGNTQRKHYWSI